MYKFYLQDGDLNEATSYYIDIISRALLQQGEQVVLAESDFTDR